LANAGIVPKIRPPPLPSKSFPSHRHLSLYSTLYSLSYWESVVKHTTYQATLAVARCLRRTCSIVVSNDRHLVKLCWSLAAGCVGAIGGSPSLTVPRDAGAARPWPRDGSGAVCFAARYWFTSLSSVLMFAVIWDFTMKSVELLHSLKADVDKRFCTSTSQYSGNIWPSGFFTCVSTLPNMTCELSKRENESCTSVDVDSWSRGFISSGCVGL
jgi:hypothetical protein